MKINIMFLLVLSFGSLQAVDAVCECPESANFECSMQRSACPRRVYALRRFDTEGEINYTNTSWASKLEDSFYDNLTH